MEPQIQYAKTSDGMDIAFYTLGAGKDVIAFGMPGTHLLAEWPVSHQTYETAAQFCRWTRFDPRGFGMSTRPVDEVSPETIAMDIEAVVSRIGAERVSIIAITWAVPGAIVFAARHPDLVERMVLSQGSEKGIDYVPRPLEALVELARTDWDLASESITHFLTGWEASEQSRQSAAVLRAALDAPDLLRFTKQLSSWDVSSLLSSLTMPVLLIPAPKFAPVEVQRRMATSIPDARVVAPSGTEAEQEAARNAAIGSFVLGLEAPVDVAPPSPSGLRAVLFTDLVRHTEMMQRLGDARGRDVLREHEQITRETLKQHGGDEVKTMGDGFMASFGSVNGAMECAVALQKAFERRNVLSAEPLEVRIGLNAGEPVEEDGDLFGSTVILASRIASQASGGEILVSDVVRQLAAGKDFLFSDRGVAALKGFDEPVRVFAVRWRE